MSIDLISTNLQRLTKKPRSATIRGMKRITSTSFVAVRPPRARTTCLACSTAPFYPQCLQAYHSEAFMQRCHDREYPSPVRIEDQRCSRVEEYEGHLLAERFEFSSHIRLFVLLTQKVNNRQVSDDYRIHGLTDRMWWLVDDRSKPHDR